jgi:hypothetical protein
MNIIEKIPSFNLYYSFLRYLHRALCHSTYSVNPTKPTCTVIKFHTVSFIYFEV